MVVASSPADVQTAPRFDTPDALAWLEQATGEALDALPFGLVRMDRHAMVTHYNAKEARDAGLSADRILGKHFFSQVAPCTDNYMVSGRFDEEENLDTVINFVFTLRMRPTPVRLRLLKAPDAAQMYVLIQRG